MALIQDGNTVELRIERGSVFRRALSTIKERGWTRNAYSNEDGAVCLLGAVNVAMTGEPEGIWADAFETVEISPEDLDFEVGIQTLVAEALGMTAVGPWNDALGRKVEDVEAVLAKLSLEHDEVPL